MQLVNGYYLNSTFIVCQYRFDSNKYDESGLGSYQGEGGNPPLLGFKSTLVNDPNLNRGDVQYLKVFWCFL